MNFFFYIQNCLNRINRYRYKFKINLISKYYQMRVVAKDILKIIFNTYYDKYEFVIMLFKFAFAMSKVNLRI